MNGEQYVGVMALNVRNSESIDIISPQNTVEEYKVVMGIWKFLNPEREQDQHNGNISEFTVRKIMTSEDRIEDCKEGMAEDPDDSPAKITIHCLYQWKIKLTTSFQP